MYAHFEMRSPDVQRKDTQYRDSPERTYKILRRFVKLVLISWVLPCIYDSQFWKTAVFNVHSHRVPR